MNIQKLRRLNDYLETIDKTIFEMKKKELVELEKNLRTYSENN